MYIFFLMVLVIVFFWDGYFFINYIISFFRNYVIVDWIFRVFIIIFVYNEGEWCRRVIEVVFV